MYEISEKTVIYPDLFIFQKCPKALHFFK